ncbi:unnamed protein product [Heterobilharzia americana]|nr:unnamed protein product [Heterobilharzia americana]
MVSSAGWSRSRSKCREIAFTLCVRCNLLQKHADAAKVTLNESCFHSKVIKEIRNHDDTVIILIADLINLPHSLIPELHTELGGKRYILVGNKADQLPGDSPDFLERWRSALLGAAVFRSKVPRANVNYISIISALTGYGITELVDFLLSKRFHSKNPVYLIGSANVGKSSLFNRLLLSDLCKAEAKESIHRATISTWPGTTSGLLSFPLTLMNSAKRGQRVQARSEETYQKSILKKQSNPSYGFRYLKPREILSGIDDRRSLNYHAVQKAREKLPDLNNLPTYTWESSETIKSDNSGACIASEFGFEQLTSQFLHGDIFIDNATWDGDQGTRLLTNVLDPRYFNNHAWCYDTPGVLCEDQILNYLPSNLLHFMDKYKSKGTGVFHLPNGMKNRVLIPRTFVMQPGLCLLIGSLARLDVLKAPGSVYFTTFSHLPIHIVPIQEVDEYKRQFNEFLPPVVDSSHSNNNNPGPCGVLPPMKSKNLDPIETVANLGQSNIDVVLSGAGWVSIAALSKEDKQSSQEENLEELCNKTCITDENNMSGNSVLLSAWTPGAMGISVRTPPLVPFAIRRRGHRLKWLREFSVTDLGNISECAFLNMLNNTFLKCPVPRNVRSKIILIMTNG